MKKSLVALAALAVVGAASAQSTVTLYGVVDMAVSQLSDKNNTNATNTAGVATLGGLAAGGQSTKNGITSGILSRSRFGLKGTEDLGGGLKANFVLEYQVQPDEATTTMANRVGTVGLSGNFGALTVGRQYTPYHVVQAAMDLYGNLNDTPGYVVNAHNRARNSNSVQYASPSFGGFSAIAQVGAGSAAGAAETAVVGTLGQQADGKSFGLAGIYAAGPLVAGLAYDSVTNPGAQLSGFAPITGTTYIAGFGTTAATAIGTNADGTVKLGAAATDFSKEVKVWAAGASYDFTVVKASLAYSSLTDTKLVGNDVTSKGWNASIAAPFGAVTVLGNLGRANVQKDAGIDATITGFQLGANYALSKRTTAYALVGRDKLAAASFTGDFTRQTTAVGVRHTF